MLSEHDSIDELGPLWSALGPSTGNPLLSHEWFACAARSFHDAASLRTVLVKHSGELAAIAPLAIVRRHNVQWLEVVGTTALHEPTGFVGQDSSALDLACRTLLDFRRPIVLQRFDAADPLLAIFTAAARARGKIFTLTASGCPFVTIDTSWPQYFSSLSARRRQDYRRARRRLEQEGRVEVDIRCSSEASVADELAEAMRVEAASWKGRAGSSLLNNESMRSFFQRLTLRLARRQALRMCFLRLNGTAVAAQICVEQDRRWWVLKIGYDERWAALSPGVQLMWDVLRHAFERGLRSFELLGTAEEWLRIWTRSERAYRTLVFYPYNVRGVIALGGDTMRTFGRRMRWRSVNPPAQPSHRSQP